ncbi:MAG: nucleoside transporter, partial [Candidatus Omnitrophica bacterium]|nr:nucleoside transporter [Candidatus Omnitrophota bacterium]
DGLRLTAYIAALLIALLGLLHLLDQGIAIVGKWLKLPWPISLTLFLQGIFYPFAAVLGIHPADIPLAAKLLGERVLLTEVVPYQQLAQLAAKAAFSDPRSIVILSYALCGFTHIASIAIFVGGTAALAPSRRNELAWLGPIALLAATLATLMTGCVAGIFCGNEGILLGNSLP